MNNKNYNFSVWDVSEVYAGPGGKLWELLMGEQIHVGGSEQTDILAKKIGLDRYKDTYLLDICSALGGPARHLAEKYGTRVLGLDITPEMIKEAKKRTNGKSYEDKIEYRLGSALDIPSKDNIFDVVWGQDAWCYVRDKPRLIQEVKRVLKSEGVLAFTDWIWGSSEIPESKADYLMEFMVFPNLQTLEGYLQLIEDSGLKILEKEDLSTDFGYHMDKYVSILKENKKNIINNFGQELYIEAENGVKAWQEAANKKWVSRGLWIAKNS
ncbi:MAG: methyltransferase domain-containing protein [Candidatus Lokiarchaeota archaeon]|nr:methyltransferase domain-containing protein [Candidatus Lokiarchaeota archaeon]MBD3201905.1 methyltransferase domain-containing protein [Candidatus Lokiarchaeota archaeon]